MTSSAISGGGVDFKGSLPALFAIYGSGFALMAATMAALFHDFVAGRPNDAGRAKAVGERGIWAILAATGAVSLLLSFTRYGVWAAMVYLSLPLTIGLFARQHRWVEAESAE